jgi:excisionase family DNA binding protein
VWAKDYAMSDEILTIKEVADFLMVNERTVYGLAAAKKIPTFKVGTAWRFKKNEIDKWIAEQSSQGKEGWSADN